MVHFRRGAMALAMLLVLGSAGSASAQNLVVNPHFDTDASSWTLNPPGAFDPTTDAGGSPSSGSVLAAYPGALLGSVPVFQCVQGIVAGNSYTFGGSVLIAQQSGPASAVAIEVQWVSNSACSAFNGLSVAPTISTLNAWTTTSLTVTAPAGSVAGIIHAFVNAGAAANISIDDLFLQSNAVPAMDTVWLTLLAVGCALVVLVMQQRRAVVR